MIGTKLIVLKLEHYYITIRPMRIYRFARNRKHVRDQSIEFRTDNFYG